MNNQLNINDLHFTNDELFINLKLLSKLNPNDKLKIDISKSKLLSVDNDYLQSVTRYLYGYDRNNTLDFIDKLINTVFIKTNQLKQYIESSNNKNNNKNSNEDIRIDIDDNIIPSKLLLDPSIELLKYTSELNNVINGLVNLKITYSGDQLIQSKLDYITENIRTHVDDLNNFISLYKKL
jgi:hypothetical protein